ncbi:MAG: metallophosphoesterase [Candidatus Omnitrophica bacterium]|nr:metallophosphoesterase [Candidatus Omnitrophota bacterium]
MKVFVIGDIHGAHKALVQCLQRCGFDYGKDRLIVLGDVCDGYPQVRECIDELLKIKHLDFVIGNHDLWALDWATKGIREDAWLDQGGRNTIASYGKEGMPPAHIDFLKNARRWLEFDGKLFVHGGFDPRRPIGEQPLEFIVWDRDLLKDAWERAARGEDCRYGGFEEIYLGHTPTHLFDSTQPLHLCNIRALDTGAGWWGKLTIMDITTKHYWQSDMTPSLYPGVISR